MTEETSPDVCYRHPQRESWTLCGRCGRTICPECQILTPSGVRCPTCVQETGGSVSWSSPAAAPAPKRNLIKRAAPRRRPSAARASAASGPSEGWGRIGQMLRPGGDAPLITWGAVGLAVVLWLVGLFTNGLPIALLGFATIPAPWEIWRFFTAAVTYPSVLFFSLLLTSVFLLLTGPLVEQRLGRRRALVAVLAAAGLGSASMVLTGAAPFGLSAVLFGMFGAYLIFVWDYPPARVQALVIMGINFLVVLFLGAYNLPLIVGGLIGGAGSTWLFQRYDDRPGSERTPYLIIGAAVAAFIVAALVRLSFG